MHWYSWRELLKLIYADIKAWLKRRKWDDIAY